MQNQNMNSQMALIVFIALIGDAFVSCAAILMAYRNSYDGYVVTPMCEAAKKEGCCFSVASLYEPPCEYTSHPVSCMSSDFLGFYCQTALMNMTSFCHDVDKQYRNDLSEWGDFQVKFNIIFPAVLTLLIGACLFAYNKREKRKGYEAVN